MNDTVRYLVEMEPNMINGIALLRLTFHRGGKVDYDYANSDGEFLPLDESEWNMLSRDRMVEVTEAAVAAWKDNNPLGYDTVAEHVV